MCTGSSSPRVALRLGVAVMISVLANAKDPVLDPPVLFAKHCSMCHGDRGRGDGPAAPFLEPVPRGFHKGSFLLVRTENRIPTDDDLASVIRRGMPGSAMPSWEHLGSDNVRALARFVRTLAVEEMARDIERTATTAGQPIDHEGALAEARERLTPDTVFDPGPEATRDVVTLAEGRALYSARCAVCHGRDGSGQAFPQTAAEMAVRDLKQGILKGEATYEALMRRIVIGLPGTAMPQGLLTRDEATQVVAFLQHDVLPEDADVRQVQRRRTLRAQRVETPLPIKGEDPRWKDVPAIDVVLAPLHWNVRSLRRATLQAVHDREHLSVRVRYHDETRNDHLLASTPFSDGVAVQFARTDEPSFQGMGRIDAPSSIWHWKSFHVEKTAGFLDLLGLEPHGASVDAPSTQYRPAPGILTLDDQARPMTSEDLGKVRELEDEGILVQCRPTWTQGTWDVVFTRRLNPGSSDEVTFERGAPLWISLALWNGAAEEYGPRKSVSLWHAFQLE